MSCGTPYLGTIGPCGGCGCTPCAPTCNYNVVIQNGSGTSGITGAQNVNIAGVGVLDAANAGTLYFRGVESADASVLSVSLNATNHTVLLTLDVNAVAAALPQATTTQAGVGETATDAEAQSKASTTVFLTPSNLAALGSSTTFAGLVELATNAETQAGVSTTLAVTPAGLASVTATIHSTETYADAVALAAGVPAFVGQFAAREDTAEGFVGNAAVAGAWNSLFTFGTTNSIGNVTTTLTNTGTTTWDGVGSGTFIFSGSQVTVDVGSQLSIASGCNLSMDAGSTLSYGGASIPANSVITTGASIGQLSSSLKSTFVSTANTQTGWSVTNPSVTRTIDVSSASLADVRAVLGTLINDLKAVKLPAT